MRNLHKLANILFIIAFVLTFVCGCQFSDKKLDGQTDIEKARKNLSELSSGKITVTNISTNEVEETFTFRFDEVGIMSFSIEGVDYAQFCNGYETYTLENGEFTKLTKKDNAYQSFTFDVRHPMADEDYLYLEADKVIKSESYNEEGKRVYTYDYEPALINADASMGKLKKFQTVYTFSENGDFISLDEISIFEKDGAENQIGYRIEISNQNSVDSIGMPEQIKNASENKG